MPPLKLDYEFTETVDEIRVTVKLGPSVPRKNLDVLVTDALIKVNAQPYLLQLDLYADVDEEHGTATIASNLVSFVLPKRTLGLWGRLLSDADAPARAARREASIEAKAVRDESRRKAAKAAEAKLRKEKEEEVWRAEVLRRDTIDRRKDAELEEEREKIKRWQERTDAAAAGRAERLAEDSGSGSDVDDADSDADEEAKEQRRRRLERPAFYSRGGAQQPGGGAGAAASATASGGVTIREIGDDEEEEEDPWKRVQEEEEEARRRAEVEAARAGARAPSTPVVVAVPPTRELPAPRQTNVVKVNLTKLEQPNLPAREQREKEIKMWKKQQQDQGLLLESQDITERQPVFLKDKGDEFLRKGNVGAAINAYSRAIDLERASPHPEASPLPQLLANRAAARLKAGEFLCAAEDCSAALEALQGAREPATEAEAEAARGSRFRLLVRRGTALAELGNAAAAAADFEAALRLRPDDARVRADLEELRACAAPLDPEGVRKRGDARFKAGDLQGAIGAYDAVLRMPACPPLERAAALANRAAACMAGGDFGGAADDAEAGVRELLAVAAGVGARGGAGGPAPPREEPSGPEGWLAVGLERGSAGRAALPRLLARRGAARGHLRLFEGGARDLLAAAALLRDEGAPEERVASLEEDARRLQALAAGAEEEGGDRSSGGGASSAPPLRGGGGASCQHDEAPAAAAATAGAPAAVLAAAVEVPPVA